VPDDVDYRTMLTFLEFYETLLKFALFKLYHAHGLRYPPPPASERDEAYLLHGRLLAIKAQALDDASEPSTAGSRGAAAGEDEDEPEEVAAGLLPAGLGKGAPGNAAAAAAKAAAKRVKAVRKRLAKAAAMAPGSAGGQGMSDEEDEEDDDAEGAGGEEDEDEAGGLGGASGLSRAEVNTQLEAALVAATGSSSSSSSSSRAAQAAAAGGDGGGDGGVAAPLVFAGLVFWLSRESQYAWLEFAIRCGGGAVGWAGSAIGESDPSVTHVVYDRPTAPQLTRSDVE
jgi:pescadillo protein